MNKILLEFEKLYNYQSIISVLINEKLIKEYSAIEIHCVDIIGKQQFINGKQLAQKLCITKGAVSKLTKRLQIKGVLHYFKKEDNQKEKYFQLTDEGWVLFRQHGIAHKKWIERDEAFLSDISQPQQEVVLNFLVSFNEYLKNIIQEEENEANNY